jgi:hypothetical protein
MSSFFFNFYFISIHPKTVTSTRDIDVVNIDIINTYIVSVTIYNHVNNNIYKYAHDKYLIRLRCAQEKTVNNVYRAVIALGSKMHTKHINTLCGQNIEFVNIKRGGSCSNHWAGFHYRQGQEIFFFFRTPDGLWGW